MENMIKKIVDADDEAKAMEKQTLIEKEELSKEIDKKAKAIYESYMNKAMETVKRNDAQEEKLAAKQWEEVQKKHKSISIKLNSDYDLNCEKWSDQIVKRAIG